MEKRAFKRHIIRLAGQCSLQEVASYPVEIVDFCTGGMLLSFAPADKSVPLPATMPRLGDVLEIGCAVPTASGKKNLRFHGRVVHAGTASTGIAYIEPDFEALQILQSFAKDHPVSPDPRAAHAASAFQADAKTLASQAAHVLPACKEMAEGYILPIAQEFLAKVDTRLFDVVGTVSSIREKNACYDAMHVFKKHGEAFMLEFEAQMHDYRTGTGSSEVAEPRFKEVALSLVEEAELEDWLAFSDLSRNLEEEFQEELHPLEQRLSLLLQTPINKENNPFGPAAFTQAFQHALNKFTLERRALQVSYAAYKDVLSGTLGKLYEKLNRYLIAQGVLPELPQPTYTVKLGVNKRFTALRPQIADTEQPAAAAAHMPIAPVAQADQAAKPAAQPATPSPAIQPESAAAITPSPATAPMGAATQQPASQANIPPGISGNQAAPSVIPASTVQDWYQLVQSLGNFQQYAAQLAAQLAVQPTLAGTPAAGPAVIGAQVTGPAVAGPVVAGAAVAGTPVTGMPSVAPGPESKHTQQAQTLPTTQVYSAEELLRALSQVKLTTDIKPGAQPVRQDVQTQLLAELAKTGAGAQAKMIPARSAKALEVAENLLNTVLADKLVSDNVRPWLQQLALPLIKLAIRDDTVFSDKSHAARQLLDRISQLELYGEGASNKGMDAIRQRVNALLGEITSAAEVTPELFGKVLKQVDMIIHLQHKAYIENVRDVAAACEVEEKQRKPQAEPEPPAFSDTVIKNPAFQEWQKKTKRLKVGDWLLLDVKSKPQRLRLAWISKNQTRFVFVNVKGWKGAILTRDELALQLSNGTALVVDDGGAPLVDRAQFAMLQDMHSKLLHETTHDHLTGLVNRREFERHIGEALASARQQGLHHILYVLNLNQFSLINSTFGYSSGDRLLVDIAQLLRKELGEHNILSRIGGNEFGMLLENSQTDAALRTAYRHREAIQKYRFTHHDKSLSISFSAALIPIVADSENAAALLQTAEASCRIARDKGSNQIQVYQADAPELTRHLQVAKWVTIIDKALDQQSLVLRHQPIVKINAQGTSIFHSEVLLGVPDENGKLISPTDFILAAEHYRRMPAVDRWVIENTFRWMVQHNAQLTKIGGLAINLSGASLNEEGLFEFILDRAQKLNVPMGMVCFEVTETAGVANLSNAADLILRLKQSGCMFSLDDFGSGMSSYAYLKNLPVDFLKIDGSFIKNLDENPYDYAVVKSITEVGHFMGKKIIAECVENERILSKLRAIGVDYAQGFVIAKPVNLLDVGTLPTARLPDAAA